MAKVVVIKTDNSVIVEDTDLSLEYLQKNVDGYVQVIDLPAEQTDPEVVSMWLNEEGKFSGLEVNNLATNLWERSYGATDVIVGDVVLSGGTDEEGESLGLTDIQVSSLLALFA